MDESLSLFDSEGVADDTPEYELQVPAISAALGVTAEGGPVQKVTREHPPRVREVLRRAGLSEHSELTPDELERATLAAQTVGDGGFDDVTPSATIRRYIMPAADPEGVTDES